MEHITLAIDGRNISCEPGISILDAALKNGIKIPNLCHHPHLESIGSCRLCLVEDEKSGRLWASCVRLVSQDMVIRTDSPRIRKHRVNIVRLMMASHPESCIVCNRGNRCELRKIAAQLGLGGTDLYDMPHYTHLEDANPFIVRDLSKCILCGKCIRADHELVVVGAIDYNLRGFKSHPAAVHDMPLEKSNCTFCGTCVSMCPTGALLTKNTRYVGTPQKETKTICGFCGVGCSVVTGSVDDQIVDVNPSHEDGTVNRSTLCVRGHFAHDFLSSPKRLSLPLFIKNGERVPVTWEEALSTVADRLLSIKKKNGPQSIGFYGSSKCTVEENYLFQKMARVIFETNNVDNGGYLSGRPILKRLHERLGGAERIRPLKGLEGAEVIFVIGANPTQSLPVAGYYLKRASRLKGIPLILTDPIKNELAPFSSLWLPVLPHRDCELLNGLAAILLRRGSYDRGFIELFTKGFDQYADALSSLDMGRISQVTGLPIHKMERAAGILENKRVAFVVGHGITQQKYGIQAMDALINLALLTGSLGGDGKGIYPLAKENNEMGAWDMGTAPDFLPGRSSIQDERSRKHLEQSWHVKVSPDPGLNIIRMIEEAERGNITALYIMGENPVRALPESERVKDALKKLEFLVVQDILHNETTPFADVVLPGAAFSEKEGSFTNLEGRIQSFLPSVSPPGRAKPDWEILDLLGQRVGYPESYRNLDRIREEISRLVPMYTGLDKSPGEAWIQEASPIKLFHPEEKGDLVRFTKPAEIELDSQDEAYPFKAIIGSLRYHLGSGTRTGVSDRIRDFNLEGPVELSHEDGKKLQIQGGNRVRISSIHGSIDRKVKLTGNQNPGLIFIPMAFNENSAWNLFGMKSLDRSDSIGVKEVSVSVEKISS